MSAEYKTCPSTQCILPMCRLSSLSLRTRGVHVICHLEKAYFFRIRTSMIPNPRALAQECGFSVSAIVADEHRMTLTPLHVAAKLFYYHASVTAF